VLIVTFATTVCQKCEEIDLCELASMVKTISRAKQGGSAGHGQVADAASGRRSRVSFDERNRHVPARGGRDEPASVIGSDVIVRHTHQRPGSLPSIAGLEEQGQPENIGSASV
jgi:hypothetical protein